MGCAMGKMGVTWRGVVLAFLFVLGLGWTGAEAARIKDIAEFNGIRDNQLIGYGLVVGLAGTGDDVDNGFTKETLANLLSSQGLYTKGKKIDADNTAAVMITAVMPPFARVGTKVDVTVSSIGDAKSLQGGTLLMTPLKGADGQVYAVAQGPVVLGGFTAGGSGARAVKNHPAVGTISNGAFIERELRYDLDRMRELTIQLQHPDFTTAGRVADVIRSSLDGVVVRQVDGRVITVAMLPQAGGSVVDILPRLENLEVPVDAPAVVVMNERTGTVVMGENVRISTVAVSHGNLSIQIREDYRVSQPLPFAPGTAPGDRPVKDAKTGTVFAPGGQTVVTQETTVGAAEEKRQLMVVPRGVTIDEVVKALNAIGVTPRDLITILQTIKAAGALQADLKII
ncbi:MAG: flagellar basal body P-ring protein FlgI [Syntrophales bacterium]|nr:flagellar basal body P-ring protein FlgI [Syntrophales bacterium]